MTIDLSSFRSRFRDKCWQRWSGWVMTFLIGLALPSLVQAHAVNVGTEPVHNVTLANAPETIEVRFNEPVTPVFVRVFDPATGEAVNTGTEPQAHGNDVQLDLTETLPDGGYVVSWRVISADSHPVAGSFRFAVGSDEVDWTSVPEQQAAEESRWLQVVYGLVRGTFLLGLLVFSGGLLFHWLVARTPDPGPSGWHRLSAAAGLVAVSGALQVALQGIRIYGPEMQWQYWQEALTLGMNATIGQSTGVAMAGVGMAWALLYWNRRRASLIVAWCLSLLALTGLLMTGHVATAPDRGVTLVALGLHALLASFWLGALPPLMTAARDQDRPTLGALLQRFSAIALIAVVVLVAAGLLIAWYQVESLDGLLNSAYGRWLVLKVFVVTLILLVAVDNKWRLTQGLIEGRTGMRSRLRRNLRLEWLGMLVVLLATAALSTQMPPRSDLDNHDDHNLPYSDMGDVIQKIVPGSTWDMDFQLAHDSLGENQLLLAFYDQDGQVRRPQEVVVRFSLPELDIEGSRQTLEAVGPLYVLTVEDIVLPGEWRFDIEVLVSDFEQLNFSVEAVLE